MPDLWFKHSRGTELLQIRLKSFETAVVLIRTRAVTITIGQNAATLHKLLREHRAYMWQNAKKTTYFPRTFTDLLSLLYN